MMRPLFKTVLQGFALITLVLTTALMPQISWARFVAETVKDGNADGPYAIAVNNVTNRVYVPNFFSNNITVINGAIGTTSATFATNLLTTPATSPYAVAINKRTNKVYVANNSGSVTVINGAIGTTDATVATTLPAGGTNSYGIAYGIAVNEETNKIYVINSEINGSVTEINGAIDSTPATVSIKISVGINPRAIAVNSRTNMIYVANYGSSDITVIKGGDGSTPASFFQTLPLDLGTTPNAIAVNEVTNKVYVTNNNAIGKVMVINGAIDSTIATVSNSVPVGDTPVAVAVNEKTNKVYVANQGSDSKSDTISVLNGAIGNTGATPFGTVNVGSTPKAITVNDETNKIYVVNLFDSTVTVIDGAIGLTEAVSSGTVTVGTNPTAITVNTETNRVYVANFTSDDVTVIQAFHSINITKVGAGTVTSSPDGINCGATCMFEFPEGPVVVLSQIPDTNSGFTGWGGGCSGTGDCAFSLLSNKEVSANFSLSPLVKNLNTGVAYSSLQNAYNEGKDNHVILAQSTLQADVLNLDQPIPITIEGGYDADYSTCIGLTPVLGRLNVSQAALRVQGLAIRPIPVTP